MSRSVLFANGSKIVLKLNMQRRGSKECTKIYNARAQLLFFSSALLFGDVLVAVVIAADLTNAIVMKNVLDGTNPLGII